MEVDLHNDNRPDGADAPRPFAARDLVRHTLGTWASAVCVVIVMVQVSGGLPSGVGIVVMIALIALVLTWLGAPLAWALGRAMRRVRSILAHLLAFSILGYVAGSLLVAITAAVSSVRGIDLGSPQVIMLSAGCAGCVLLGRTGAFLLRWREERRARLAGVSKPTVAERKLADELE